MAPRFTITPERAQAVLAALRALPTLTERLANPPAKPWTPEWVVPVQPAALAAFTEKLHRVNTRGGRSHSGARRSLYKIWDGECAYCGSPVRHPDLSREESPLTPAIAEHLIPIASGGMVNNLLVLSCTSCNTLKGGKDWLVWGQARSKKMHKRLMAMRMEASRYAYNHLSRDPVKVRTALMIGRMLDARWEHPRFRVYASMTPGGCFLGVKPNWPLPQAALFIIKGLKGQLVSGDTSLNVYQFDKPAAALEAIWALIDINAWVLSFDLEDAGFPHLAPKDAPEWRFWSPNFKDLVKRELAKARPKWAWKRKKRDE
jgi:hypothetical protein